MAVLLYLYGTINLSNQSDFKIALTVDIRMLTPQSTSYIKTHALVHIYCKTISKFLYALLRFKSNAVKQSSFRYFTLTLFFICGALGYSGKSLAVEYNAYDVAKVQILNKITGKSSIFIIPINTVFEFDNCLSFVIKACYRATQKYDPDSVMFIQMAKAAVKGAQGLQNNRDLLSNANSLIDTIGKPQYLSKSAQTSSTPSETSSSINTIPSPQALGRLIFSGWMFANHPEVSGLTDPVYDVTLLSCKGNRIARSPDSDDETNEEGTPPSTSTDDNSKLDGAEDTSANSAVS